MWVASAIGWPRAPRTDMPAWLRRVVDLVWSRRGALIIAGLGVLYVGVTFLQVLVASGDDDRQPADAIVVLGAAQYDG